MKITSSFSTSAPFVDKASRVKDWVYNATEVFIQFCTEHIWHYLEQNLFSICKINTLCTLKILLLSSPCKYLHHLEKDPSDYNYIDLAQVKDISPIFKIYQIADRYQIC